MSRKLYESLFDPTEAEKVGEDAAWMSLLTQTAAELRAWRTESLAEAEFEEGLWVEDDPQLSSEVVPLRLAASDNSERDWPVTYRGGSWAALLSLDASGQPYVVLLSGPGIAILHIGEAVLKLEPGKERPLPDLDAPPASILVIDEEGQQVVLQPVS
ncbi:MAG: hypothetical protein ACI8RZ_001447 [Myxococcota bacterium]|jgi:hypothetical protein